ncbi:suppressor of IKBKE 1-like [Neomonachus schauinslandi]|uniref:Suppressor of IKBKE 1 n=1 Tax=Neomonachus schauinslandi TaxID=29088 RepID=A0A8M1M4H0_NEOSC|nr:suppressor of IKBKE 1-like [Neomonachus schauinslandi]
MKGGGGNAFREIHPVSEDTGLQHVVSSCTSGQFLRAKEIVFEYDFDLCGPQPKIVHVETYCSSQFRPALRALPDQVGQRYPEDASDIKDMSKFKPHILLSQENTQIRDLQQENRELWVSLEEHQDALELIMSKYQKMLQLMVAKKAVDAEPVLKAHQSHPAEIESQIDRIYEMGEVMRKAVQVDDDQFCKIQEKLAQLELENKELRELLSISSESLQVRKENSMATASQAIK